MKENSEMNVAFIPVRGGSKSIPLKNIKIINGKPLIYWTAKAASECQYIDIVYIATDSDKIKETVESFLLSENCPFLKKIKVIGRSIESATDTASTEFAMLEFAEKYEFDNICLIQATSPLLTNDDLDRGFVDFFEEGIDSVLSVVPQKRFYWEKDLNNHAKPVNYDVFNRPRRQDFKASYVENGAFYITSKAALLSSRNRVSGTIKMTEMCEESFFEIDEPSDWIIIESLMKKNLYNKPQRTPIKMFLTDCDGCLTDGGMYYSEFGDEMKKFNTRDGVGFSRLKSRKILTGIITAESVALNERRVKKLGLDIFVDGCKNKLIAVLELCKNYNIKLEEVAYIGDDINDLEVLREVGYSCCPNDAHPTIKSIVDYIATAKGGDGVIREVADKILLGD